MKNKMYTTPPRKAMMYGGMSDKKGAMMGGTQMSAPKQQQKKDMNPQLTMAAQGMAKGGKPMSKDPKTGKMMPTYAMDGKGKMMYGGKAKKK